MLDDATLARRRRAGRALLVLSVAVHLAGVLGLYWLPVEYASTTYLSENALQPGSFEATMMEGGARVWADIKNAYKASNGTADWVGSQLGAAQLTHHRLEDSVFGVVPSSRGDNSGCVVVSAHYQSRYTVAYALRLAQHLATRKGLGRDVVFLFTDNSTAGAITRWLQFYYSDRNVASPPLFRRSGPVLQALHLDFAGALDSTRKVVLALEGPHLPNLDLLNAFVTTCTHRGVDRKHILTARRFSHPVLKKFPATFAFFMQFFINQFCGGSGSHAEFNAFAADSMTVATIAGTEGGVAGAALSDCIEGSLRGLLSIQEPLHQSFYFYLLPSATQYVSIGHYMILFGMISAVVPLAMATLVLDPQYVKSVDWDWRLLLPPAALFCGSVVWWLPMDVVTYAFVMGAAFVVALLLRQPPGNLCMVVTAFVAMGAALTVCSLVNFSVATVGSVLTVWHLLCWWVSWRGSRIVALGLFALLDPLCIASLVGLLLQPELAPASVLAQVWSLRGAPWYSWMCLAYIPFRALLLSSLVAGC